MKTTKKILAVALIAFTAIATLTAETSGLRIGTAYTIQDDVYDLNNVITWNRLDFNKFIGFTNISSSSEGNLAGAFHIQKDNILGLAWNGNLWNDNNNTTQHNSFTAFYGFNKNKALKFTFTEYTQNFETGIYKDYGSYYFNLDFGMTVSEKIAFSANANLNFMKRNGFVDTDLYKSTTFGLGGTFYYTIAKDEKLDSRFYFSGTMDFTATTNENAFGPIKTNTSQFSFTPGVYVQYKITPKFTYGFNGWTRLTFAGGDTAKDVNLYFNLQNGFTAKVTDIVTFNMGIYTTLPSFKFPENGKTEKGNFSNSFYAGFAFNLTDAVRIDASAFISPEDGMSFDEVWKQNFNLSVRVKF